MNESKEIQEKINRTFNVLERKRDLVGMWESVSLVCQSILAKAKENPAAIKASLLREVINSMKGLREIIEFAQDLDAELKEAQEIEESPDGMTAEERREIEVFEEQMARLGIPQNICDPETAYRYKGAGFKLEDDR